jgi:hypothetical protein
VKRELQERRFSDREFALILRRAQELQDASGDSARLPRADGMSLTEIRHIAAEVGIGGRYVELAAGALPPEPPAAAILTGAPWEWEATRVVPGELPESEKGRVLDAIRSVVKDKGELETAYGRLEWTYDDELGPVQVRVVPASGETRVETSARRTGAAGIVFGVSIPVGGVLAGSALSAMLGLDGAAIPAAVIAMAGASWMIARAAWRAHARQWERKVALLCERVADAVTNGIRMEDERP